MIELENKLSQLYAIYEEFENKSLIYKQNSICARGCAFCCTHFGNLDVTTLEAYFLRQWIFNREKRQKVEINKKILKNKRLREQGKPARCPFLNKNNTCLIYMKRPFSCRKLYSVKPCQEKGPTLHKSVHELALATIHKLQQMDNVGYSGHLSYVLYMLDQPAFFRTYDSGQLNPSEIQVFGKTHGIMINHYATALS